MSSGKCLVIGVRMKPGWIELTRMLMLAQFDRRRLGQAADRPLRRDVRVHHRRAAQSLDRRDVDDRAAAGRLHRFDDGLHAEERSGQVDVDDLLPLGHVELADLAQRDDARRC